MLDMKKALTKLMKAPIVVEQGTSGIWTYRKWSDGTAECWGHNTATVTFASIGNGWRGSGGQVNFPFTFKDVPRVFALHNGGSTTYWSAVSNANPTTTTTGSFTFERMVSTVGSTTVAYSIYAIGTWK